MWHSSLSVCCAETCFVQMWDSIYFVERIRMQNLCSENIIHWIKVVGFPKVLFCPTFNLKSSWNFWMKLCSDLHVFFITRMVMIATCFSFSSQSDKTSVSNHDSAELVCIWRVTFWTMTFRRQEDHGHGSSGIVSDVV